MRFYPIHVIVKDFSFMFLYIVLSGSIGPDSLSVAVFFSMRMISGFIVFNLIIQTVVYLGLKHYVRWRRKQHKFLFGMALHIPTILFWIPTMKSNDNLFVDMTAIILSSLVSGTLYIILNGGLWNSKRKSQIQES